MEKDPATRRDVTAINRSVVSEITASQILEAQLIEQSRYALAPGAFNRARATSARARMLHQGTEEIVDVDSPTTRETQLVHEKRGVVLTLSVITVTSLATGIVGAIEGSAGLLVASLGPSVTSILAALRVLKRDK